MFCLKLFGGATLVSPEGPMTGRAVQRRRLALAALLAVARERGMSRDKLLAYLWPEADAERARHLLSDSVYRINQALGREAVVAAGDGLRLSPELPSDVGQFEDAVARGEDEAAVALYAGPFLDGFFVQESAELERWIEGERRRLGDEYAGAVERLAEAAERAGDERTAVRWWRRVAAHDPFSSRIALHLMRALERSGDRPAAIQHAGLHGRMLQQELGARPDPEVTAFARELLTAPLVAEPPPAQIPAGGTAETDLPPGSGGVGGGTATSWRFVAAAIVVVGLGLAVVLERLPTAAQPPAPISTIAVLPFENLSSDRDAEYLSDGITEEIGAALGRVEGLRVAAHTSAFSFKGQRVDVREVGKRLGVGAVLEGSVRKQGPRLRVTTRLVETAQGYQLWTETYDRDFEDAFAVQQEIAGDVVSRLRGERDGADSARLVPVVGPDAEAYDLYLKGRYAWHRRTAESIRSAVELLGRAVERAPHWARAHAGLADAYAVSGFYDYLPPREAFPAAERSARRALELDPELAAPHATLGYVHLYYEWRWIPADEEFRRAIALDPAYSTAHQWYGNYLTAMGRFPEAVQHMREAQERDPLSLIANAALGWSQYYARDYLDAVTQFRRTLELNPAFELAHLWQGQALVQLGDLEGAAREIGEAVRLSKGTPLTRAALAHVLASAGKSDSARAVLAALTAPGQPYVPSYEIAKAFLALGDEDKAMEWLERAYAERAHSMAFLSVDPQLDGLRKDRRFEALRKKVTNPEARQLVPFD